MSILNGPEKPSGFRYTNDQQFVSNQLMNAIHNNNRDVVKEVLDIVVKMDNNAFTAQLLMEVAGTAMTKQKITDNLAQPGRIGGVTFY